MFTSWSGARFFGSEIGSEQVYSLHRWQIPGVDLDITGSILEGAAASAGESAGQFITASLGWWTSDRGVDFDSPALETVQSYTMPLSMIMLVLGVIFAAIKTALARKGEPLVHLATNLIVFLVVSVAGTAIFGAIQVLGDDFSRWILQRAGDQLGRKFAAAATSGYAAAFGVILLSLLCILIAFIQWVMMLFRMAALIILAGALPLAGAASVMQGRTESAVKVVKWSVVILLYKPTAALIYATGFATISEGGGLLMMLEGVVILIMAIVAMPALAGLFAWVGGGARGGGGGGVAAAAGMAGLLMARGGGGGAASGESGGDAGAAGGGGTGGGSGPSFGGIAGSHAREMESGGPGARGLTGGDQPTNSTSANGEQPGPGGNGTAQPGGLGDTGAGPLPGGSPAGGGGVAGADLPASAGSGGSASSAALAAGQQTYQWTQGATESAADPSGQGPDRPS